MGKSEKMEMIKSQLDIVHDSYNGLLNIRPEIEQRIKELEKTNGKEELIGLWKKVKKEIDLLEKRPRILKPKYIKGIMNGIKKIKEKYPDEYYDK